MTFCGAWLTGCQSLGTFRGQSPAADAAAAGQPVTQQAGACGDSACGATPGGCGPECGGCGPAWPGGGPQMHYYLHQGCPKDHLCRTLHPHHGHGQGHPAGMAGLGGYVSSGAQAGVYDPGPGWYPRHHHTYFYDVPDDGEYVYPPTFQPPAVVQYPYYTVRGPSDFFMQ